MANFTKTITNSIRAFGLEKATTWGQASGTPYTMVWGTTKWGEGSYSVICYSIKVITNSVAPSFDYYASRVSKVVTNSVSPAFEMSSEQLSQGVWEYVFPSNTNELESRVSTNWSDGSSSQTSFTCQAAGTTTWT